MNKIYIFFGLVLLVSCGLSVEEKKNVALNACSIMGETKKSDSLFRMQTIVDARETIGGEPFVGGDDAILEAFNFGLCEELVLNESYNESLQPLKDAKRERERIAAEKLAEENRIAAEKQRIADSKPTVKEEFYSNGKSRSRTNYLPKSDGGKEHGLSEYYHENGQLMIKGNYKDGKKVGLWENYHDNGKLNQKGNFKDGKRDGLKEIYRENGQLFWKITFKDGNQDGIFDTYHNNGQLNERKCYNNGETTDMSYCEK
jgi:antitoxin component YwqK of YwqJK toxin-antitoxin module